MAEDIEDEVLEELGEEEEPPRKGKAKPSPLKQKEIRKDVPRYAHFIVEAQEGIIDSVTGQTLATNLWDALTDIKNDLAFIKEQLSLA